MGLADQWQPQQFMLCAAGCGKSDDSALSRHGDVRFSGYGNLVETVVGLVCDCAGGLTAAELGKLVGVNPYSLISRFGPHPAVYQVRLGGRFVYLAPEKSVRAREIAARRAAENKTERLSDAEAVVVLVDLIQHPDGSCLDLSRRLKPPLLRGHAGSGAISAQQPRAAKETVRCEGNRANEKNDVRSCHPTRRGLCCLRTRGGGRSPERSTAVCPIRREL